MASCYSAQESPWGLLCSLGVFGQSEKQMTCNQKSFCLKLLAGFWAWQLAWKQGLGCEPYVFRDRLKTHSISWTLSHGWFACYKKDSFCSIILYFLFWMSNFYYKTLRQTCHNSNSVLLALLRIVVWFAILVLLWALRTAKKISINYHCPLSFLLLILKVKCTILSFYHHAKFLSQD